MNDDLANVVLAGMLDLACSVRDDGASEVAESARRVLDAAHGDPIAALTIAACLIRLDLPVDAWWQRGLDGVGARALNLAGKACTACGKHKRLSEFVTDRSRADGLTYECRSCRQDRQAERRRSRGIRGAA